MTPADAVRRAAAVRIAASAAVLAVAASAASVSRAADSSAFAGSASCRKCHAAAFARWQTSSHFLGTRVASDESLPPEAARGGEVVHGPAATRFLRQGARFVAEVPFDDGRTAPATVDHVVGVRRMKMLVTRLPDGRRQVLPSMREEPGGAWFDYTELLYPSGADGGAAGPAPLVRPGEPSFWTGPDRSFDARCARCHTSGYEVVPTPDGALGARSSWRALGVDCEQCHGPSAAHVEHWESGPQGTPDPILRLAALPRERALDVCLSCHLEAEPYAHGFAPGDDLLAIAEPTLLDDTVRLDAAGRPLELVYEGASFLSSACANAAALRCTDCHDAHGSPHPSGLVTPLARTNSLCVRCHADVAADGREHTRHDPAKSGGLCINCHMPLVTIERGHGAVHDHTIGVSRPAADARDACSWCHLGGRGAPADAERIDPVELARSFREGWPDAERRPAWAAALAAGRAGDPGAAESLRVLAARRTAPAVVRASAARLLGRVGGEAAQELVYLASDRDLLVRRAALAALAHDAGDDANAALRGALSDPSLGVRAAAARAALQGYRRVRDDPDLLAAVLPVLEEDAAAVPEDHARWFRLGSARRIAGDERGALAAYERKLQLDPAARMVRAAVEQMRAKLRR